MKSETTIEGNAGVSPPATGRLRAEAPFWATATASFFGIGRLKPGPGTWASALTVSAWALASWLMPLSARFSATIIAAAMVIVIGIPAATRIARATGVKDPQFVVIDEVAGQLIALIAVPLSWKTFLASLILFRAFDILKPPPVRQLEQLPEGSGIMFDDVGAGIYALLCMHLAMHFGLLIN